MTEYSLWSLDDRIAIGPDRCTPYRIGAVGSLAGCLLYTSDAADE